MRKIKLAIAALFLVSPFAANADLIFSDLSYTSNSFTFTVDGTLTGTTPGSDGAFGIQYLGDLFNDLPFTANTWSTSVFDGLSLPLEYNGNTGTFGGTWGYSWSFYDVDLGGAVATNRTITLTMGDS